MSGPLHDLSAAKKIVCKDCELKNRKPAPILDYFAYEHLPEKLQRISKPIGDVAFVLNGILPDGPEKSAGLRKLLEAKDCMVRASL